MIFRSNNNLIFNKFVFLVQYLFILVKNIKWGNDGDEIVINLYLLFE